MTTQDKPTPETLQDLTDREAFWIEFDLLTLGQCVFETITEEGKLKCIRRRDPCKMVRPAPEW